MWIEKDIDLINRFEGPLSDKIAEVYYKFTDEKKYISFMDLEDQIKNSVLDVLVQSKSSAAKTEFINQLSSVRILNKKAIDTPHFVIEDNKIGIRLNINDSDITNTLIHEIAHHIDYNLGQKNNSNLMFSNSKIFIDSLKDDWNTFVRDMMKCYNCSIEDEFFKIMTHEMQNSKDDTYLFASDIIGGLTKNKCIGNAYHEVNYWSDTMLCAETFAHFYEAVLISPKQEAVLKNIFPNTFDLFENMF